MIRLLAALAVFLGILLPVSGQAHEARPGFLEVTENIVGHYRVLWKRPAQGEYGLSIAPVFPADCNIATPVDTKNLASAQTARFALFCEDSLDGKDIRIDGLEYTLTDTLVRFVGADGVEQNLMARPENPRVRIGGGAGLGEKILIFLRMGVEHIAGGYDHLLFVFGLMLIAGKTKRLILAVTSFTIAHSISLAFATLGFLHVPAPPVEAVIALSILFLGVEAVRWQNGQSSLTIRFPWLVAFIFGLLHGLGFAGALREAGLAQSDIPVALLFFNIGVELGQIAFVITVLLAAQAFGKVRFDPLTQHARLAAYSVGTLGAFWTIERVADFL